MKRPCFWYVAVKSSKVHKKCDAFDTDVSAVKLPFENEIPGDCALSLQEHFWATRAQALHKQALDRGKQRVCPNRNRVHDIEALCASSRCYVKNQR